MSPTTAGTLALVSFVGTWLIIPRLIHRAPDWSLVDHPGGRKIHDRSTPMVGGIGMIVGISTALTALVVADSLKLLDTTVSDLPFVGSALVGTLLVFLVGLRDDRRGLRARVKVVLQSVATLPLLLTGGPTLLEPWAPAWLSLGVLLLGLLAIQNAFNLLDGLDGLMGSVALICAIAMSVLAWTWGASDTLVLLSILVGALVGFLRWNLPKAETFAGDGGSLVVGYLLAAASLQLLREVARSDPESLPVALLALALILAIPAYDLCSVMWIRFRERRHLFVADTSHLAHRMVGRGLSHVQALALIGGCALVTTLAGLLLARVGAAAAPIVVLQCLVVVGLLAVAEGRSRLFP